MKKTERTKVWKATGFGRGSTAVQLDMACAAPTRAAAARIMGVTPSWLAKYGTDAGTCPEAEAEPSVLFIRRAGAFTEPYRRV